MTNAAQKQVSPVVAIMVILVVIALAFAIGYRAITPKRTPPPRPGGPPPKGGGVGGFGTMMPGEVDKANKMKAEWAARAKKQASQSKSEEAATAPDKKQGAVPATR